MKELFALGSEGYMIGVVSVVLVRFSVGRVCVNVESDGVMSFARVGPLVNNDRIAILPQSQEPVHPFIVSLFALDMPIPPLPGSVLDDGFQRVYLLDEPYII